MNGFEQVYYFIGMGLWFVFALFLWLVTACQFSEDEYFLGSALGVLAFVASLRWVEILLR